MPPGPAGFGHLPPTRDHVSLPSERFIITARSSVFCSSRYAPPQLHAKPPLGLSLFPQCVNMIPSLVLGHPPGPPRGLDLGPIGYHPPKTMELRTALCGGDRGISPLHGRKAAQATAVLSFPIAARHSRSSPVRPVSVPNLSWRCDT